MPSEETPEVPPQGGMTMYKWVALALIVIAIIVMVYVFMQSNSMTNPDGKDQKLLESNLSGFDVEKEVEKLREKQRRLLTAA